MPESGKAEPSTPRILIVDDDPGQRSLLNSFLKSQGFETAVVDSGMKALEALRGGAFSMMISDVRMPGLSGLETLRQARKEQITGARAARHGVHGRSRCRCRHARWRGELPGQADRFG